MGWEGHRCPEFSGGLKAERQKEQRMRRKTTGLASPCWTRIGCCQRPLQGPCTRPGVQLHWPLLIKGIKRGPKNTELSPKGSSYFSWRVSLGLTVLLESLQDQPMNRPPHLPHGGGPWEECRRVMWNTESRRLHSGQAFIARPSPAPERPIFEK